MTSIVTAKLQEDIKQLTSTFELLKQEALQIYNIYWKGGISGDTGFTGLAGGDPATQAGKLTKDQVTTALTLAELLKKFFDNEAVATGDYMASVQDITHGDAVLVTVISSALEDFGGRALQFATDLLTQYGRSKEIENLYTNGEVSGAVSGISAHTIVFGSEMSKDDLTSAITMIQQFHNFMENAAVTTGDYDATLAKWLRF
jgi:hypothetical protein